MTVSMRKDTGRSSAARLTALVLGAALVALPGVASARQEDHRGQGGGGQQQQQQPARPAPAAPPRAAPPQYRPAPQGGSWRGPTPGGGQAPAFRQPGSAQGNPMPGGWQGRPQGSYTPGRPQGDYAPGRPQGQGGYAPNRPQGNYAPGRPQGDYAPGRPEGDYAPGRPQGGYAGRPQANYGQTGYGRPGNEYQGRGYQGGQWNHGWRQDQRYDWRGWRDANRDTFHGGRYYPPYRGYGYSRLGVGFYLQPLFFGSDYWIDPDYYHLPPAYGPYHWVRYYNDVLLVDSYTGQVADVIYDFFL